MLISKPITSALTPALTLPSLNIIHTLVKWMERSKQRKALAQLDERLLADIALTPSQVSQEIQKPFWQ